MRLGYDKKDGFEDFVGRFGGEVCLGVSMECWGFLLSVERRYYFPAGRCRDG